MSGGGNARVQRGRLRQTGAYKQWKIAKDERLEEKFGHGLHRARERVFVEALAGQIAEHLRTHLLQSTPASEVDRFATIAAVRAGYKRPAAAKQLLRLERIKEALAVAIDHSDIGIEKTARILGQILHDPKSSTMTKLRAIELRFKLTTGFAPTRVKNLNTRAHKDALFDPALFKNPPPIATVKGQDKKNVGD